MGNPEIFAPLVVEYTACRQGKQKTQHRKR